MALRNHRYAHILKIETDLQGPIENKNVSGTFVRQAADYIKYRLDIIDPVEKIDYEEPDTIVIFSRRGNRLIVNEDELKQTLERTFKLQVKFLRMEEHSFKQQVEVLNRAKIALGMHGSMLIMTLFMPKGSALVEMYPFAVPSENYSPYKTMCRLEG
jgi:protein O-mannose beta-1,4-N-acetylglucosaminyltransferase